MAIYLKIRCKGSTFFAYMQEAKEKSGKKKAKTQKNRSI